MMRLQPVDCPRFRCCNGVSVQQGAERLIPVFEELGRKYNFKQEKKTGLGCDSGVVCCPLLYVVVTVVEEGGAAVRDVSLSL